MVWAGGAIVFTCLMVAPAEIEPQTVRIPISKSQEIDVAEVVARLAERTSLEVPRPPDALRLPIVGLGGTLTRELLGKSLGADISLTVQPGALILGLPAEPLEPDRLAQLERGMNDLAAKASAEVRRRNLRYGIHARPSYRPNDPERPTVCLVHGMNSSAGGFVHMVGPLEAAGFGVVFYDYPYNRDLDETSRALCRDWADFRRKQHETRPWAIVAHSLGALVARWYVEADRDFAGDVSDLVLIAPPNHGCQMAQAQTLLQFIEGVQAVNGKKTHALASLSDGIGAAADDMLPGSAYLKQLNSHSRRAGVRYHILAGDSGFLNLAARRQVEAQLDILSRTRGLIGGLSRLASGDLKTRLDEMTEGLGDGCVSVASTRLDGVTDHETIHANHAELIRAPLLYPDPGPVACMPFLLRWLGAEAPATPTPTPP